MKRLLLSLLLLTVTSVCATADNTRQMSSYSQNISIFSDALKNLNYYYVDTVNNDKLTERALTAMLLSLDPYTVFFTPEEAKLFRESNSSEYAGLGCTIVQRDDAVYISEIFKDTPAQESEMRVGDKIVAINGDTVVTWKSDSVSSRMRGRANTTVSITLQHRGEDNPYTIDIMRRNITRSTIPYYGEIADGVGYIRFNSFSEKSSEEFRNALTDLKNNHNIDRLVIDLRDNGGGIVDEAVKILGNFVPHNTQVLTMKSRTDEYETSYSTTTEPIDTKMPIVVLINGNSASAAEVVAGTLQDLDRAVIMGTRSFGKGLVQTVIPLPYDCIMKLTTAYYYIPSGRSIQAIDYAKSTNENGLYYIPDSLTNEYRTSAGRIVRDGGGIVPDIEIKEDTISNLLSYLYTDFLIPDFAVDYVNLHGAPEDIENFTLTDEDYTTFKEWVKAKEFKYDKYSNKYLDSLREVMKFEGYINDETTALLDSIAIQLNHNIDKDLDHFRPSIEKYITREIATITHYSRGGCIIDLRNDAVVKEAIEVLLSPTQYNNILLPKESKE